jgi:predicted amidohydrolase
MKSRTGTKVKISLIQQGGGIEKINRKENVYFGRSCVINPMGTTLRRAPAKRPALISQEIDLREVEEARKTFLFYEARRPVAYGPIVEA